MVKTEPLIAVYLITYQRHELLRRSLASVLAQTYVNFVVKIVNDDPSDRTVAQIVAQVGDNRVSIYEPVAKRGGTRNFNLVFEEQDGDFVSLLEDDNWWEPRFLEEMLETLTSHPKDYLVVGNERVWEERNNGDWRDTGRNIWPFDGIRYHRYQVEEICGSAKLCNSSMLVRVAREHELQTCDTIPVDVTEHFRERVLPPSLLLNGRALVNFAVTIKTARATRGDQWGVYQRLLIGSVFFAARNASARKNLAERLWAACPIPTSPRAVTLVAAGLAIPKARALLWAAPLPALGRFGLWIARRPWRILSLRRTLRGHREQLAFLVQAPLTRNLAQDLT